MCIKVTTVVYASLVKYFKNATIRAYAGLKGQCVGIEAVQFR